MASSELSYAHGTSDFPLLYTTIPELVDTLSRDQPDKPLHVFRYLENDQLTRLAITSRQLADRTTAVAAALLNLGLKPGDHLAILGSNSPEWLYLDYACLRIKVLLMRIPITFLKQNTLVDVLERYSCRAIVINQNIMTFMGSLISDYVTDNLPQNVKSQIRDIGNVIFLQDIPEAIRDSPKVTNIAALLAYTGDASDVSRIQATLDPDDVALIYSTSGSTGTPKFVEHSFFSYMNGAAICHEKLIRLSEPDTVYMNDRSFGWMGGYQFVSVLFGITMVHLDATVTASGKAIEKVYQVAEEEKATSALWMAYLLYDAMKAKEELDIQLPKCIRFVLTGGERTPKELLQFARTNFESTSIGYGSTECTVSMGGTVSMDTARDTGSLATMYTMPHFEVKIVDDDGKTVPRGTPGVLQVRSACTMRGYLNDPDMTNSIRSASGWVNTGDVAVMNEEGLVEIVGRTKDVISRGGYKVYPKTLEDILVQHPSVDKALVVGIPDERLFEEICACVIIKQGATLDEDDVDRFFRSKMLNEAFSCVPKYYLTVDSFPLGITGKFDRKSLATQAADRLGNVMK